MKTYKILEVSLWLFRIRETVTLWSGQTKVTVSLSRINKGFLEKYCPSSSSIANFHHLLGSLICTISTKFGRKNKYPFLNIDISKWGVLICSIKSRENQGMKGRSKKLYQKSLWILLRILSVFQGSIISHQNRVLSWKVLVSNPDNFQSRVKLNSLKKKIMNSGILSPKYPKTSTNSSTHIFI